MNILDLMKEGNYFMGRKKGSLNKATIERLKAEGKWNEGEQNEATVVTLEDSPQNTIEENIFQKQLSNLNSLSNSEDLVSPEDLIPINEATMALESVLNNSKTKSSTTIKGTFKASKELVCERCGEVIDSSPYRIDTNAITARPEYHRETPRYVNLCSKCSSELSKLVDNWLLSGKYGTGLRNFPL